MTDTNATAAETPADAPTPTEATDTLAAPETAVSGTDSGPHGDDEGGQDDGADSFPRHVVEKLRREAATLRDRARTAENTVAALQRKQIESAAAAAGLKPAALWAVAELADLLGDDGTPDPAKLNAAMHAARAELGIQRDHPKPGRGSALRSGSGVPQEKPRGFAAAFGPKRN